LISNFLKEGNRIRESGNRAREGVLTIVAFEHRLYETEGAVVVDLLLGGGVAVDVVEGEGLGDFA
jgi:hypothetical protein